jgi:hypothetical protein
VKIDALIEWDPGVGASALLLTPMPPSAWLERHAQVHILSGEHRAEHHARRCPSLRGPTLKR